MEFEVDVDRDTKTGIGYISRSAVIQGGIGVLEPIKMKATYEDRHFYSTIDDFVTAVEFAVSMSTGVAIIIPRAEWRGKYIRLLKDLLGDPLRQIEGVQFYDGFHVALKVLSQTEYTSFVNAESFHTFVVGSHFIDDELLSQYADTRYATLTEHCLNNIAYMNNDMLDSFRAIGYDQSGAERATSKVFLTVTGIENMVKDPTDHYSVHMNKFTRLSSNICDAILGYIHTRRGAHADS